MPSLGQSGLDVFYAVPPSGVALGLVQSPDPDISIVAAMDTYTVGNELPLNPSLTYEQRFRWVELPALSLRDVNVVLNPLLQYADPTNVQLNVPPPNWVFTGSSQTASDRWKFYPYLHTQSSTVRSFPMSDIYPPGVGNSFTIMFPCGFAFLYSPGSLIPSNPEDLHCTLGARCGTVQLNVPYVLEIYYFVHADPPFKQGNVTYPSDTSWKDSVYVRCQVYGLNSSNVTTENPITADLRHRRTNNTRGRLSHLALDESETPVRRWVVSTRVTFTNPATVSAEVSIKVAGIPGFALLGVLMYPLSELRTAAKDTTIHPAMYTFNAGLKLSAQYGGRLDQDGNHFLQHGIDGPLKYYARIDRSAYGSGPAPRPASELIPLYRLTNGEGIVINVRDVMSNPPSLRFRDGDPPTKCSYITDDPDARPNVGVLPVPYTGGYTSVPMFITQGVTKLTYEAPSTRQYANWIEFLTDDIPVRPGIRYRLVLETNLIRDDSTTPAPYPYPNTAAPYMRFSFLCYQAAVYGYDKDGNMVEIAFLAPFGPGAWVYPYRWRIHDDLTNVVTTALMAKFNYNPLDWGWYGGPEGSYPNYTYPFGFIIFNNSSVVKARVGLAIVQPYVRRNSTVVFANVPLPPGNDTTPYLLVPPPDIELIVKKIGLHEMWPVPYSTGQATFLDEDTADFKNGSWRIILGPINYSTSGNDHPNYQGGIEIYTPPDGWEEVREVRIDVPWTQSSELYLWPCIRMRFRTNRLQTQSPPYVSVWLSWNDGWNVAGELRCGFLLAEELFPYGEVTSLGGGWYEVDLPLGKPVSLKSPYPTFLSISLYARARRNTSLYIGYFNVGFYDDPYGKSSRRVQEPAGFGLKLKIDVPYKPPRVVGVEQISRYHWGVRIRPGLVYQRYVIPNYESDHSWLLRAGFNRGDDLVLVYTLPEYTATSVGGVPVSRRMERVMVQSGVFHVERPIHNGMEHMLVTDGVSLTGPADGTVFHASMFGREVTIKSGSLASYTGPAEFTYWYYSPDYVYTGCWWESASGPVPAAFNLSAHSKSGLMVGPFPRQFVTQQYPRLSYGMAYSQPQHTGASIFLLPSMAIPYSRFVEGDRVGTRLPAHSGAVRSYVRHILSAAGFSHRANIHDSWEEPRNVWHAYGIAALRIAYIGQIPTLGWTCVDLTDIRTRGGGLPSGAKVDVPGAYWDMSEWDGGYSAGAGRAIVRLPRSLLLPDPNREAFTHEHIVNLVNQYLPAGIDYEVEYVD